MRICLNEILLCFRMAEQKNKAGAGSDAVDDREKFGWPKAGTSLKAPENSKAPVWKYFGAGTCGKTSKDANCARRKAIGKRAS